jgi:cytochrome bd-type quinol oxidase subunit 2
VWAGALLVCAALGGLFYWGMTVINARHLGLIVAMGATAAYMLSILAVTYGSWSLVARTGCFVRSEAARLYRRRQSIAITVYVVLLFGVIWAKLGLSLSGPAAYAIAVLPCLPLVAVVAAMGLYLREERDEFERMVQVESALWATGVVLVLSTAWGFIEMLASAPHVPSWVWFPLWSVSLGFGNLITRRRFR